MSCNEQKSWKVAKSKDEGVGECVHEVGDADSDEGCDKIAWLILGCLGVWFSWWMDKETDTMTHPNVPS